MECKLIKGNEIQFGTYGFEHIDLPPERPDYWDTKVKVAKIAESTSLTQGRFGVTLKRHPPALRLNTNLPRMKRWYTLLLAGRSGSVTKVKSMKRFRVIFSSHPWMKR